MDPIQELAFRDFAQYQIELDSKSSLESASIASSAAKKVVAMVSPVFLITSRTSDEFSTLLKPDNQRIYDATYRELFDGNYDYLNRLIEVQATEDAYLELGETQRKIDNANNYGTTTKEHLNFAHETAKGYYNVVERTAAKLTKDTNSYIRRRTEIYLAELGKNIAYINRQIAYSEGAITADYKILDV